MCDVRCAHWYFSVLRGSFGFRYIQQAKESSTLVVRTYKRLFPFQPAQVRIWVFTIGFSLSFGALFAKIWQAYRVYTTPALKDKVGNYFGECCVCCNLCMHLLCCTHGACMWLQLILLLLREREGGGGRRERGRGKEGVGGREEERAKY